MSMTIPGGSQGQNRTKAIGAGAVLGMVGMNAYFLPVTKDRFVRNAFNIIKEDTQDTLDILNESAVQIANKNLKAKNKLFLSQIGLDETIDAINAKCIDLKNSITDKVSVKNTKQFFENNFKDFKKSEALMDDIASRAFSRIKWTNFTWGTAIGFILGAVFASGSNSSVPYIPSEK